jgi:hypothetical protein
MAIADNPIAINGEIGAILLLLYNHNEHLYKLLAYYNVTTSDWWTIVSSEVGKDNSTITISMKKNFVKKNALSGAIGESGRDTFSVST